MRKMFLITLALVSMLSVLCIDRDLEDMLNFSFSDSRQSPDGAFSLFSSVKSEAKVYTGIIEAMNLNTLLLKHSLPKKLEPYLKKGEIQAGSSQFMIPVFKAPGKEAKYDLFVGAFIPEKEGMIKYVIAIGHATGTILREQTSKKCTNRTCYGKIIVFTKPLTSDQQAKIQGLMKAKIIKEIDRKVKTLPNFLEELE